MVDLHNKGRGVLRTEIGFETATPWFWGGCRLRMTIRGVRKNEAEVQQDWRCVDSCCKERAREGYRRILTAARVDKKKETKQRSIRRR